MPTSTNSAFVEAAGNAIARGLRKMGPRVTYETISAETASEALKSFEAQPRYSSELMRKLDGLSVSEGIKTNAEMPSIKARVSNFGRKSGRKFKVFQYENSVYIVRKE
jgi:hypothetical protein